MKISARGDYACKALLELAFYWPGKGPVQIHTISERQDIPMKYLVQILLQLKRAGLVESIRGKHGGYVLTKAPSRIRLSEVLCAMGEPLLAVTNIAVKKNSVFSIVWKEVEEAIADVLNRITFEDILKRVKGVEGIVNYQI